MSGNIVPTDLTSGGNLSVAQNATIGGSLTVAGKLNIGQNAIYLTQIAGLTSALAGKANLVNPHLTGIPTAPTATLDVSSTQIATTAFVKNLVSDLVGGAPPALDTLKELATALSDSGSLATSVVTQLGTKANLTLLTSDKVAIGTNAGSTGQSTSAVAIGTEAGKFSQSENGVAIGANAGFTGQGDSAVAMGVNAGFSGQRLGAVAVGANAGNNSQGIQAVAIGDNAGYSRQGTSAVAIGYQSGRINQGENTVAIGNSAGQTQQGAQAVAIGFNAGSTGQGARAVAIGRNAGRDAQGQEAVAMGFQAGQGTQGQLAVAIGNNAGFNNQGSQAVAMGSNAGFNNQGASAVAMGFQAGRNNQGASAVAIGSQAGLTRQGDSSVAIGREAGYTGQGTNSIAIGRNAGKTNQGANSIIIDASGGTITSQESGFYVAPVRSSANTADKFMVYDATTMELKYTTTSVADRDTALALKAPLTDPTFTGTVGGITKAMVQLGSVDNTADADKPVSTATLSALNAKANLTSITSAKVAIGMAAGIGQGFNAVAVGYNAGNAGQDYLAVAIGPFAGYIQQRVAAVAVGSGSGYSGQGTQSVAIGNDAGKYTQGTHAIAIGYSAGKTNQPQKSIVINASGDPLDGAKQSAFYVNPISTQETNTAELALLMYNPTTSEVVRSTLTAQNNAKTFVIDHPTNDNKYLVHACLEGPESGVYYRGKGQITNNLHVTIQLPDYVEHLATEFTIQITPIYSGKKMEPLYTSEVENNSFTVYGDNCAFYWHVTGKRGEVEVEPSKDTTNVKGSGPYKWI